MLLAGFYSHNYNYTENQNVSGEYLSTFTIITVPAVKEDANDMSWLHTRKPMLIAPGTKVWYDWLDPKIHWNDKFVETVLNSTLNQHTLISKHIRLQRRSVTQVMMAKI